MLLHWLMFLITLMITLVQPWVNVMGMCIPICTKMQANGKDLLNESIVTVSYHEYLRPILTKQLCDPTFKL
jgi:hypothetical protein